MRTSTSCRRCGRQTRSAVAPLAAPRAGPTLRVYLGELNSASTSENSIDKSTNCSPDGRAGHLQTTSETTCQLGNMTKAFEAVVVDAGINSMPVMDTSGPEALAESQARA